METRKDRDPAGEPAQPVSITDLIARLGTVLAAPSWSSAASLRQAVRDSAALLRLLRGAGRARAERHAVLMARAIEKIGKGAWPAGAQARSFVLDCLRDVANRCGVRLELPEEEAPAAAPALAAPRPAPPPRPAAPPPAASPPPPKVAPSPPKPPPVQEPIALVLEDEGNGASPPSGALALPRGSLYVS